MSETAPRTNAQFLTAETRWLGTLINCRLEWHAANESGGDILATVPPDDPEPYEGSYPDFLERHGCEPHDRLMLILALAPFIAPQLLDPLLIVNQSLGRRFTEFGGQMESENGTITPTLQTALFLLAGNDLEQSLAYQQRFADSPLLDGADALMLDRAAGGRTRLSHILVPAPEAIEQLLWGREYHPPFSSEFPAEELTTALEWPDLVLPRAIAEEIDQILIWIRNSGELMADRRLSTRLAPGYRALFAGPPGTGKTLTASLLGKATGRTVFRVDISKVVSKYIGETEKNLARLFDRARNRDWILFFDEADALFGKRGEATTTSDRAANQNVSYLLQRIESFDGVVILASNLQDNIDDAFARRFQSIIHFPTPDAELRHQLWTGIFEQDLFPLSGEIDWHAIAREYEVTGGQIVNVLRYCCLVAAERDAREIGRADIVSGVRRELMKENRIL